MTKIGKNILIVCLSFSAASCEQEQLDEVKTVTEDWVDQINSYVKEKTGEDLGSLAERVEQVQTQIKGLSEKNLGLLEQLSGAFAGDKTIVMLSKVESLKDRLAADIKDFRSKVDAEELSNQQRALLDEITNAHEQIEQSISEVKKASSSHLQQAKGNLQKVLESTVRKLDDLELSTDEDQ